MTQETFARLFGFWRAFDDPFTVAVTAGLAVVLLADAVVLWVLSRPGRLSKERAAELLPRLRSWLWLAPVMLAPVLLGAAWVMAAVCLLSLLCYQEFARATGMFREKTISAVVVLGIAVVTFAVVDHWDRLFFASAALTVGLIAVVTIPQDRPKGYLQRTALGVLGFLLFGYSLGYVGYLANGVNYRPVLLWLLVCVQLNDVFAYAVGKAVGGPKAFPQTSPGKTVAGCLGALVLTTALTALLAHLVFRGTAIDHWGCLVGLGLLVSSLGQLGDLVLSSLKRDVGIKDMGSVLPGMGGLLDRFDSLILVPPAVFHYLALFLGPPAGAGQRLLTGGG
jgi:phosphatidate cytidylyltransferase